MSTQSIRPSQFITTYGPGAIIEGKNGPRLIPRADIGLFSDRTINVEDFEISDSRMSEGILKKARVFRLPSNAELGRNEQVPIYRTRPFPNWNLCVNSSKHPGGEMNDEYILYHSSQSGCPYCKEKFSKNQQAVRFIAACPEGHLDDFDWYYFIHNSKNHCNNRKWFRWSGGGSSLSNIILTCPDCGLKSKSLEQAYKSTMPCHGIFQEREKLNEMQIKWSKCDAGARIIQRQASNLRITNTVSLFTIPPRDKVLHRLLDSQLIRSHIMTEEFNNKGELETKLRKLEEKNFIKRDTVNNILACTWDEISHAINDLKQPTAKTYQELINEELAELIKSSKDGAPPIRKPRPSTEVLFEVNKNNVKTFKDAKDRTLVATPISKLTEIAVQLSYRREIREEYSNEKPATSVDVSFIDEGGQKWYPGMELHGEGIFISTVDGMLTGLNGKKANEWNKAYPSSSHYDSVLFRDENHRVELNPLFVYLHTLSHSIIRSLSVDSGYSSSALRERVYLNFHEKKPIGGILIYATQPGGDGTSGGLISLVDSFQHVYDSAIHSLQFCSNDPLCLEDSSVANAKRVNGSSCYGCTLVSETSCEHRNMWLDRGIILEDLP